MPNGQPDLLTGVGDVDAAEVKALARRVTLAPGDVLFNLGDAADSLYIVERGRVALSLPMQVRGRVEDVQIEERMPGQALGWSALIPPHRFTLKATAPLTTDVLALARAALLEHFAARPALGYAVALNVAAIVGQRLQVFQAMWLREIQRVVQMSRG